MSSDIFPYGKRAFVTNLLFIILLILSSLFLILIGPVDLAWLTILLFLEILVLFVLGVSPFLTYHELINRRLILKQGWYFHTSVDLHEIANIEIKTEGPSRIGVYFKVFESSAYIIAQKGQVIILKLREPRRFGLILGKKADRVVFDVIDINRFVKRMEEEGVTTLSNPVLMS